MPESSADSGLKLLALEEASGTAGFHTVRAFLRADFGDGGAA